MKPAAFAYAAPRSLDDALCLLAEYGDDARVLAGGQSLMPALNLRMTAPAVLVDINGLPELAGVRVEPDGTLVLGALTRHRALELDLVVARLAPLLALAAPHVAHLPIRTRGTLGGSLAHADPAAEWPAVCLALDAVLVVRGAEGERSIPTAAFQLGVFSTALDPGEVLVAVRVPSAPVERASGFAEVARRHGDFALVGAAVTVDRDPAGCVTDARVVLFGAADRPTRRPTAEAMLRGRPVTEASLRAAAAAALDDIAFNDDLHASAAYRRRAAPAVIRRALAAACDLPAARLAA